MNQVQSKDGTRIAYEITGNGPSLILIGGAFCDRHARASGTPLAKLLAAHFTVFSYDRRGRGDSSDTLPFAIEREVEDLDALIAAAGGRAYVYGISSGGLLALESAARELAIDKIAVYEAPLVLDVNRCPSENLAVELDALSSSGKRSEAAELFLTRVVGVPAAAIQGMKQAPMWRGLEALAHTLSYDVRLASAAPTLVERVRSVRASTLGVDGGESPPWMHEGSRRLADAVSHGTYRTLDGQTHDVKPAALATALMDFFGA
jgi:pimeloyl-ACP methyl ester carboxylesterase